MSFKSVVKGIRQW